jgi:ferritin
MLSKKIETALNKQMNLEMYSSYIYLAIAAYFDEKNLEGFAHWMKLQAQEELMHSIKIFDHILERDGKVKLMDVKAPPATWKSPLAACEAALKHEKLNTKQINSLMDLSYAEKDHASKTFLQWFVDEQVEEEASATALVERLKMVGNSGGGLFMLDRQLASRQLGPQK